MFDVRALHIGILSQKSLTEDHGADPENLPLWTDYCLLGQVIAAN